MVQTAADLGLLPVQRRRRRSLRRLRRVRSTLLPLPPKICLKSSPNPTREQAHRSIDATTEQIVREDEGLGLSTVVMMSATRAIHSKHALALFLLGMGCRGLEATEAPAEVRALQPGKDEEAEPVKAAAAGQQAEPVKVAVADPEAEPVGADGHKCSDQGDRAARFYSTGIQHGENMVKIAWRSVGEDCQQFAEMSAKIERVIEMRAPKGEASDDMVCRAKGFLRGAEKHLGSIRAQCR